MFHDELDVELKTLKNGTRTGNRKWPRKKLLELAVEAGSYANKKTPDPNWPILTALMVSIYRDESAKVQAIETYNMSLGSDVPKSIGVKSRSGPMIVAQQENEEDFD